MNKAMVAAVGLLVLTDCAGVPAKDRPSQTLPPPQAMSPPPQPTAPLPKTATLPQGSASAVSKAPGVAKEPAKQTATLPQDKPAKESRPIEASLDGVLATDLKVGSGPAAKPGQRLTVNYVGTLADGTTFDSTDQKEPLTFELGSGQMIAGWDRGFTGMKAGGKRKIVIPPELAYGKSGVPPTIPPNSKLIFNVELLSVE